MCLQWEIARRVVLSKILAALGGRVRHCTTGGAALSKEVQNFFTDMGVPLLEVRLSFSIVPLYIPEDSLHTLSVFPLEAFLTHVLYATCTCKAASSIEFATFYFLCVRLSYA